LGVPLRPMALRIALLLRLSVLLQCTVGAPLRSAQQPVLSAAPADDSLHAVSEAAAHIAPDSSSFRLPPFYHSTDAFTARLHQLATVAPPGTCTVDAVGVDDAPGLLPRVVIRGRSSANHNHNHTTATATASAALPMKTAVLIFGEHAREVVTTEVALRVVELLAYAARDRHGAQQRQGASSSAISGARPTDTPASGGLLRGSVLTDSHRQPHASRSLDHENSDGGGSGGSGGNGGSNGGDDDSSSAGRALAARLMARDDVELHVLPVVNPRGRLLVEQGDFCKRENDNGVDLNRNWGALFALAFARTRYLVCNDCKWLQWRLRAWRVRLRFASAFCGYLLLLCVCRLCSRAASS
jgi:hypothetical protein